MTLTEKIMERKILLKRAYPANRLFEIGRTLLISSFENIEDPWSVDADKAAFEIASTVDDAQLRQIFATHKPRRWASFNGQHYTLENGALTLRGGWENLKGRLVEITRKYGKNTLSILKAFLGAEKECTLRQIAAKIEKKVDLTSIISELENSGIIAPSYVGEEYKEWQIPEEVVPLVQIELGLTPKQRTQISAAATLNIEAEATEVDYVSLERQQIAKMDDELNQYLMDLLKNRLDSTITFGKTFSVSALADYLTRLFGYVLYFDSLLSIVQQYSLADAEIVHTRGKTGMRTGWNLALFGEPGTGKSFSTRDMILGAPEAKVYSHGIPGRNRYAGGMTPARFIRIGQAYAGRTFNFIIPEFNDWFRYKGMVEPLKLAMERATIKYELHREVIGPYKFNGFFCVNYNVATYGRGYEVTISDPNFNAIEDRMFCRLHRLTKQRFIEIAQSQKRLAFGEIDTEKGAKSIRDHVTLIYAVESGHPLVRERFPYKPVMITPKAYETIEIARNAILDNIPREHVTFSTRLEDRALRFACAASLINYFESSEGYIPISEDALKYAVQLYVEEASVRSQQEFTPEEVLRKLESSHV